MAPSDHPSDPGNAVNNPADAYWDAAGHFEDLPHHSDNNGTSASADSRAELSEPQQQYFLESRYQTPLTSLSVDNASGSEPSTTEPAATESRGPDASPPTSFNYFGQRSVDSYQDMINNALHSIKNALIELSINTEGVAQCDGVRVQLVSMKSGGAWQFRARLTTEPTPAGSFQAVKHALLSLRLDANGFRQRSGIRVQIMTKSTLSTLHFSINLSAKSIVEKLVDLNVTIVDETPTDDTSGGLSVEKPVKKKRPSTQRRMELRAASRAAQELQEQQDAAAVEHIGED